MCSVNDYDCGVDDKSPIISKAVNLEDSKCKKCEEKETVIILRGKDTYCKSCFLTSATHKFRSTLGKTKIVRPNDNILVAHSGNSGSSVLLHLIRAGMHESVHKRLIFKSTVLYIDEGVLEGETFDQRKATVERISNQIQDLGFTGFVTTINESLSESEPKISPIGSLMENKEEEEEEQIKNTFAALSEATAKEDLLMKLRHRLLIRAARHLNCNKIFTAESATSLSISILSNISMGRGAHLSLDVGFTDTRYSDIMILRPIRGFTNMEIDYYIRFHNVEVPRPLKSSKVNNSKSIQSLIQEFVNDLDSESHGTVSTVLRTGEKLCTTVSGNKLEKYCALCNASLDTQITSEICTIQATEYSQLVSTSIIEPNIGETLPSSKTIMPNVEKTEPNVKRSESNGEKIYSNAENIGNNEESCNRDCKCKKSCAESDMTILKKSLCYGCRRILYSFKEEKAIPSFIINTARSSISFQKMHEEIAEFLL